MNLSLSIRNEMRNPTKLPADIKIKWIDALRSGKYKQGRHCLRNDNNEYCCLGVLCDIIDPTRWHLAPSKEHYKWDSEGAVLPKEISRRYGLSDIVRIKSFVVPGRQNSWGEDMTISSLAGCNDEARYTFNQIACIIERDL
jgi:hypothetical protein